MKANAHFSIIYGKLYTLLIDLGGVFCLLKTKSAAIISIVIVASKLTASWKKLWKYVVEIIIIKEYRETNKSTNYK